MRKSEKVKYEIDRCGRLKVMRAVLDGEFKIDKDNTLSYRVKEPIPASIPQQLRLSGNWSLDNEHNLVLTLDKENNQWAGDKLTLEAEVIDTGADELVFSVSTKDSDGKAHFYTLKLGGRWQADRFNRLSFLVTRDKALYDEFSFRGSWEVNRKNELIYTYTKTYLKRKEKLTRCLTFKGYWDINEKNRISYVLNKELDSGFDFEARLGKPAKRGMEYEIGIGVKPRIKKILLFGSWKVNEKLGLIFEMPYEEGNIRSIVFDAECRLTKGTQIEFRLKDHLHQDLGISLRLTKAVFRDSGTAFLEALREKGEISIFAGIGFRW
jgi:hypothetical protein